MASQDGVFGEGQFGVARIGSISRSEQIDFSEAFDFDFNVSGKDARTYFVFLDYGSDK